MRSYLLRLVVLAIITSLFLTLFTPLILASHSRDHYARRLYNGRDHFYTSNFTEWYNAIKYNGYQDEVDEAFATDYALVIGCDMDKKVVFFYRLFNPSTGDHFYTANYAEYIQAQFYNGYISEWPKVEFVYTTYNWACKPSSCGLRSLYRLFNPSTGDHFYTASSTEKYYAQKGGYWYEGVAGYVYSGQ